VNESFTKNMMYRIMFGKSFGKYSVSSSYDFLSSFKTARLIEVKGVSQSDCEKHEQCMYTTLKPRLVWAAIVRRFLRHIQTTCHDTHMWTCKHHSQEYLCVLCIYSQSQCKFGKLMFKLTSIFPPLSLSGSSTYSSFTLENTQASHVLLMSVCEGHHLITLNISAWQ